MAHPSFHQILARLKPLASFVYFTFRKISRRKISLCGLSVDRWFLFPYFHVDFLEVLNSKLCWCLPDLNHKSDSKLPLVMGSKSTQHHAFPHRHPFELAYIYTTHILWAQIIVLFFIFQAFVILACTTLYKNVPAPYSMCNVLVETFSLTLSSNILILKDSEFRFKFWMQAVVEFILTICNFSLG